MITELGIGGIFMATGRTNRCKWRGALITEFGVRRVFILALKTLHPALPHIWGRNRLRFVNPTL